MPIAVLTWSFVARTLRASSRARCLTVRMTISFRFLSGMIWHDFRLSSVSGNHPLSMEKRHLHHPARAKRQALTSPALVFPATYACVISRGKRLVGGAQLARRSC